MIIFRRTCSFPAKNFAAALAWSREVAGYCKTKFGVEVLLEMPCGGNPNRICYVSKYDSLAAMEQTMQKLLNDPKYLDMYAKSSDILTSGSGFDEIWMSM